MDERQQNGTGLATAAAVVGVIALLVLLLTIGGLFFLSLPLGIAAIVMGGIARRRAKRGIADPRGAGRARIGSVLGWITTVLSLLVLALVVVVVALLSSADFDSLPDQIQDQVPESLQDDLRNEAENQIEDGIQEQLPNP
jgi:uncharacterized protein YqgC (DUF456 family)